MPTPNTQPPYHPIIYVRGYAGSSGEVEDTVATPYMGFNLGATKSRQRWDGSIRRMIFESPLIRLMKDHGYGDVYNEGDELPEGQRMPARSVVIYRYYESVSEALGDEVRPETEDYARGLGEKIEWVRDHVCGDDAAARAEFKVYLVAHSMGGLICRCFLQNEDVSSADTRGMVDKVFTYATPHNGIDLRVLGNLPSFFTKNNADNFNRDRMKKYLKLGDGDRVDRLDGKFDPDRFFCLVGSNDRDYGAGGGAARVAVGEMSDGLVAIANATVAGAPRAFVHRSHSGHYGIVNSEEGYQNLTRFLFGDVRVDGQLEVQKLTLPPKVQRKKDDGKTVRASYQFETVVSVRGAYWDLHRRLTHEHCALFRTYEDLVEKPVGQRSHPHLFSAFLDRNARVSTRRASLAFAADIVVQVPEYEIDGFLFLDSHYEGGTLFRDRLILEVTSGAGAGNGGWRLKYGWESSTPGRATRQAAPGAAQADGSVRYAIPIKSRSQLPGLEGVVNVTVRDWNQ